MRKEKNTRKYVTKGNNTVPIEQKHRATYIACMWWKQKTSTTLII